MKKTLLFLLSFLFLQFSLVEATKTIGIFTFANQGSHYWDPDSISSGITGSEEAIIYMGQKLAKLGHQVTVFGNPPKDSPHSAASANPRFVPVGTPINSKLDIGIAWRMPHVAKELRTVASKLYLWPHDVQDNKLIPLTEEQILEFDDVLWLSKWQQEQWSSANPAFAKFTKIFGNGINPEQFKSVQERKNPYSCIYASNYGRGLDKLLNVWPAIKKKFPLATLDIYYGWNHWGVLTPEEEVKLRAQVENLKTLDVKEHGLVGHEELNRAFERTSFWTYPCTAAETFCITALRAQLAGTIPVIIQHTGLQETSRHGFNCFKVEDYLTTLTKAMEQAETVSIDNRKKMGEFILEEFTWENLALKWENLFEASSTSKKTICLSMVTHNSSKTIRKSLQAIKSKIDYWVVVDSESTDGTQQIIQEELKGIPGKLHKISSTSTNPEDKALLLAKDKGDYTLFLKPDDVLCFADGFSFPDLTHDSYYSQLTENRTMLVNNQLNWKWTGRLTCPESKNLQFLPGIINALDSSKISFGDSSPLEKDNIIALFNEFYLAQTYMASKDYLTSLKIHEKIISTKAKNFPLYPSLYYVGLLSELLNKDSKEIIDSYSKAYESNPKKAEPLFRMSAYFFLKGNYVLGYALAKQANSLPNPHSSLYNEDWVYDYGSLFSLGNCAYSLGKYEEAEEIYEAILSKKNIPNKTLKETENNLARTREALLKGN